MDRKLPHRLAGGLLMMALAAISDSSDPRSIIEAAEQAAAARDYAAAEALLRDAARVQESTLGPLHPDLANTLNNLGVVCENNDHPDEAERCFRRAVIIAATALAPDHPFVVTSRQNLHDFCATRGKPVELPSLPAAATSPVEATRTTGAVAHDTRRSIAINALGPAVMFVMVLAAALAGHDTLDRVESPPFATKSPETNTNAAANVPDAVKTSVMTDAAATVAPLALVNAQLCATLDEWLCEPEDRPVPQGNLFFYTRVRSPAATSIQHRWYRDNRLMQSVDLPILASQDVGYRSFSRYIMDTESAGNWRVELRAQDGALLYEERFAVR